MLRFIVQRHTMEFGPGIDRRDHFTVDVEVPNLEVMLRSGGSGEGGFESWQLLGVEVLDAAIDQARGKGVPGG